MSIIILNAGEQALLDDGLTGVAYDLRLFKTDVTAGLTPAEIQALDETDFTEATFTGYAAAALATVDWTVTQGDPTRAVNVEKSFASTADQTAQSIWGYYVTRDSDGAAIWFEQFDGPVVVENDTDEILITPQMTLDDRSGNVSVPIGGSILWSALSGAIPDGFLLEDGAAVSRTTYAQLDALMSAAGYPFGNGDGSTTFNLPGSEGVFPLGVASAGTGSALGDTGGTIDHVHDLDTATAQAQTTISNNQVEVNRFTVASYNATHRIDAVQEAGTAGVTTAAKLAGDTATSNPPFLARYFIIRAL